MEEKRGSTEAAGGTGQEEKAAQGVFGRLGRGSRARMKQLTGSGFETASQMDVRILIQTQKGAGRGIISLSFQAAQPSFS